MQKWREQPIDASESEDKDGRTTGVTQQLHIDGTVSDHLGNM